MATPLNMIPVVTIDGPSGCGKGTIGWRVSQRLGWDFLDSGAIYRLVALAAMQNVIELDDATALEKLAINLDIRFDQAPDSSEHFRIYLFGHDVTDDIRTETCGLAASTVAKIGSVRAALLARQRAFRMPPGLIADGRDMGTVVFPDAPLKLFFTASAEARAGRRYKQLKEKGIDANLTRILVDIKARDEQDSGRAIAPLKPADDAEIIDTTDLSVEKVEERVLALIKEKIK